jgi:hypothetical protein
MQLADAEGLLGAEGSFTLTRELREIELYLTFALHGDRKSCTRPVGLDPYYLTLAQDLKGTNERTSMQRHNET